MAEFLISFIVYLIAFAIGSFIALLVARRIYPAASEREAFAELTNGTNGANR